MQYLPHQQPGYPVHSHFTSQPGRSTSPRSSPSIWHVAQLCSSTIACRIHSWSRNPPPEAAGTCQPAVRLHWCSKAHLEIVQENPNEVISLSKGQDARFIVLLFQGALRPMPPPSIHPSASGLMPTPSMAVQIPTAKVTHPNAAQDSCFFCFVFSGKWLKQWVNSGLCFPSPVPIPEHSPGRATSRLPLPQPDQSEVLSPRQITQSPSLNTCPKTWVSKQNQNLTTSGNFHQAGVFNLLQHHHGCQSLAPRIKPQTRHPTVCVIFIWETFCTVWTRHIKRHQTETICLLKRGSAEYPTERSESLPGDLPRGLVKSFQKEWDGGRTWTDQGVFEDRQTGRHVGNLRLMERT